MSQGSAPEVTLKLVDGRGKAKRLEKRLSPGTEVEFNGVATAFTQNPFMLVFDVELPGAQNFRVVGEASQK